MILVQKHLPHKSGKVFNSFKDLHESPPKSNLKNKIGILKEGISKIGQDISWDIKKEKLKQENLKDLEKKRNAKEAGTDLEDGRELER